MLYVFWLYATDRISDLDMSVRAERELVFSAFVIFDLLGAIALWILHAPRLMIAAMLGYFVSTLIVQYITRYWKISTHAIGITAPLVALTMLYGRQPLPFYGADPDGLLGARLSESTHDHAGRRRRGAGNLSRPCSSSRCSTSACSRSSSLCHPERRCEAPESKG